MGFGRAASADWSSRSGRRPLLTTSALENVIAAPVSILLSTPAAARVRAAMLLAKVENRLPLMVRRVLRDRRMESARSAGRRAPGLGHQPRSAGCVDRNPLCSSYSVRNPRGESGLVRIDRCEDAPWSLDAEHRKRVFAVVDTAFAQRRKMLRAALAGWAGSPAESERRLVAAGIDPTARGEVLDAAAFVRLANV